MLSNIRFVLIHTTHAGNIGAAARAMKTMGLGQLYLVDPQGFPSADATAMASGADDLLGRAVVCRDLEEALAGCRRVVGTTARARRYGGDASEPRECAESIVRVAAGYPVAVLFGREKSGLTNAELDRCHDRVSIPANPEYGSLNLGAAVQVLAYELRLAAAGPPAAPDGGPVPAPAEDMERFYEHLERTLVEIGFLYPDNPRQLMRRLRHLFNRARPDENEVHILRGILTAAQRARRGR